MANPEFIEWYKSRDGQTLTPARSEVVRIDGMKFKMCL